MDSPVIFNLGKYEIIGHLGEGGIAVVYKGYHREIDRFLAIKVLRPHYSTDQEFIERFKLEARVIARLQHPHIVPLYDYGSEDDIWYLATAYIQGGSLADLIAAGPIPLRQIDKILREVASALDYAHRNNVIHRDIKPSNILIDSEGHALLADFGIVKIVGSGMKLTGTGGIVGTPAYIAPEQVRAEAEIDRRADLYSLGCVVFEMLTGQQPYRATTPLGAMMLHVNAPVASVSSVRADLPPLMDVTMRRALAKNPDARYQTAIEFYEDFTRAVHSDVSFAEIKEGLRPQLATVEHAVVGVAEGTHPIPPTTIILPGGNSAKQHWLSRSVKLIALAALVALAVVLGTASVGPATTYGRLMFDTRSLPGDMVRLEVLALPPPGAGQQYVAWLQNSEDGTTAMLGALALDEAGIGSLTYADPEGRVLLSLFDGVVVTEETSEAVSTAGSVRYSGRLPDALSVALTEIMVKSSELPEEAAGPAASYGPAAKPLNSLLDGALIEATFGQMHSGLAAAAPNVGALHIHAEHTINIMLGTRTDYNGNGRGENPGRKIGVGFFIDRIDQWLSAAASAQNTPESVQAEIRGIMACTQNIRNWMNRVIALEHELLLADAITGLDAQKTESTTLATAMLEGLDANENGQVERIEGECGLQQVSEYALGMAAMTIVEGTA